MQRLRRFCLALGVGLGLTLLLSLGSCNQSATVSGGPSRLVIGVVSYNQGVDSVEAYAPFEQYLEEALGTQVEFEPVFNELRAVEQIESQAWDLAFAPAGLAAIAVDDAQYVPLFPLQGNPKQRSLVIVPTESNAQTLSDLANQAIALGEPGSATGYYLPLYDLYGMTLAEIRFAPTPKTVLDWVDTEDVAAGALSEENFQQYRNGFDTGRFRVLHETRVVNNGAVLLSPAIERNQQRLIEDAMQAAPSNIAFDAGYIANAPPPAFDQLIQLVDKVRPLEKQVQQQPAVLTLDTATPAANGE
ncbi:MAG: phosphate/phosphite/phosphonate ABC transporter substrate-binding protein [Leptolyngbyaceae cyanobacterium]